MKKILFLIISLFSLNVINCSDKEKKEREERGSDYIGGAAAQQAPAEKKEDIFEGDLEFQKKKWELNNAVRENNEKLVKKLLSEGADPNGTGILSDTDLNVIVAANKGSQQILKMLLDAGANPNIQDSTGMTPLNIARRNNDQAIIQLLSNFKPSIVKLKKWELRSGHSRFKGKKPESLVELIQAGTQVVDGLGYENPIYETIPTNARKLFTAIKNNSTGLLRKALHEKENVNAQTSETKTTPLMQAAKQNRPALVKLLLKANPDLSLEDKDGKRFIDYAKEHPEVMEIVKQYREYIAAIMSSKRLQGYKSYPEDIAHKITEYLG